MKDTHRKHILLVDDDDHLLITLGDFLRFQGFEVTTARSGEEAIQHLDKIQPDVIILDMGMPGMGGLGFLRRISSADGKPRWPVLVFTARASLKEFFDNIEVDGFLAKPCEGSELLGKIRRVLVSRAAPGSVASASTSVPGTHGRGGRSIRILLAEDDAGTATRLAEALTGAGHIVETVRSGPEVLEAVPGRHPEVVLIKRILSGMNGDAVISVLGAMPTARHVPVILYDDSVFHVEEASTPERTGAQVRKVLWTSDSNEVLAAVQGVALSPHV